MEKTKFLGVLMARTMRVFALGSLSQKSRAIVMALLMMAVFATAPLYSQYWIEAIGGQTQQS